METLNHSMPANKRTRGRSQSRSSSRHSSMGSRAPGGGVRMGSASRPRATYAPKAARFRQGSKSLAKAGKRVVKQLTQVGVLEKKQKKGTDYNEQALVARCADNIQYKSFVATEASLGNENSSALDLFTLATGTGATQYIGKYINITSLFMRFCIQVPQIDQGTTSATADFKGMGPRKLRIMLVCPKQTAEPAGLLLSTDASLFLDYEGNEYGLSNSTNKPAWEMMSAPINKRKWIVFKDKQVLCQPNRIDTYDSNSRPTLKDHNLSGETYYSASWNESHFVKPGGAAQLNVDCSIPINKKVAMDPSTHRPEDLAAAYRFIVISELPGMKQADQKTTNIAAYGLNHVLVSSRSFLQYVDA